VDVGDGATVAIGVASANVKFEHKLKILKIISKQLESIKDEFFKISFPYSI
jgi:hypothetical protein